MSQAASTSRRWLRPGRIVATVVMVLVIFVGVSEWAGWPYLAGPMQSVLSDALQRDVKLYEAETTEAGSERKPLDASTSADRKVGGVRIRLLGGIDIKADRIEIAAPAWSNAKPTLLASNGHVALRYSDLWRASRGEQLVIRRIEADQLQLVLVRDAQKRASWQFGKPKPENQADSPVPIVEALRVRTGYLDLKDAPLDARLEATFSVIEGPSREGAPAGQEAAAPADAPRGLQVAATGRYRSLPIKIDAKSSGALGWASDGTMPLKIDGSVGYAKLNFDGTVRGVPTLQALKGDFFLAGRSLAAVGDVLGVTLPTTPAFTVRGSLDKQAEVWNVKVGDGRIGDSRLDATLRYDVSGEKPMLGGRVGGARLLLQDLGPAIGTTQKVDIAAPAKPASSKRPGRVLPAREFDLPSLRAMNADVQLDFAELDLGTKQLEPLKPLRAHLVLRDAVLTVSDIQAKAASGTVTGMLSLDGRKEIALWESDLRWKDIQLAKWLSLKRADDLPPYISGRLDGRSQLKGQGRSTAQILASLDGTMRARVREGSISHLLVEGAGIDVAQALGVLIKGDDALPMSCALTELQVANGVMTPKIMVVDTRDSVIWVDGTISLVDESLNLRAVTTPKDFSPLALRTPVLVRGTMDSPAVSLAPKPLAGKMIAAGLLALIHPLAALIPLIDTGMADDTAKGCAGLLARAEERKK